MRITDNPDRHPRRIGGTLDVGSRVSPRAARDSQLKKQIAELEKRVDRLERQRNAAVVPAKPPITPMVRFPVTPIELP